MKRARERILGGRRAALSALVLAAASCLSKPALAPQSFSIDPPAFHPAAAAPEARVLSLSRVEVAPPYGGKSFVYRIGEHGIERDPYASFAVTPGWMLTSAIRGYLRNADFVKDVVAPGEGTRAAAAVEAYASELCGDLSNPAEPSAVLTLQLRVLVPAAGTAPASEILLKTYTERVPWPQRTASAAADAWNRALAEIMTEFLGDLKRVLMSLP